MTDALACPDPLAERRFDYAHGLATEGEWAGAAELLEQVLELAPEWPPAWAALGRMREKLGDREGAVAAFTQSLRFDARDLQGAGPRLALLRGEATEALPAAYVARLFDDYAPTFETHLLNTLGYCGPQIVAAALDMAAPGWSFGEALDLGCGSGLMGRELRGRAARLIGVDISAGMIGKARTSGLYDELSVGDLVAFLAGRAAGSADLVTAADTLIYLGDLTPVVTAAAAVLTGGGLFAFTLESGEAAPFELHDHLRFRHSDAHVEAAATGAGLSVAVLMEASTRRESGADAPGRVVVLAKP